MATAEKKTYRLTQKLQVKAFLAKFGAVGDSAGTYSGKGMVTLKVSGNEDTGFTVDVIPPGCIC